MNKFLLAGRPLARPAVAAPVEARLPVRLWMTGSLAVVMAALLPLRDMAAGQRAGAMRVLRHSRYDVTETLQRLESAARQAGLPVLVRLDGVRPVIVLSSSMGGTLVVMDEPDSAPAVPLGLVVHADGRGGADVLSASRLPRNRQALDDLPEAVRRDLAALPGLVRQAVG